MVEYYDPNKDPRKNIKWMSPLDPGAGGVVYRGQEQGIDYTKEPEIPRGTLDSSGNVITQPEPDSSLNNAMNQVITGNKNKRETFINIIKNSPFYRSSNVLQRVVNRIEYPQTYGTFGTQRAIDVINLDQKQMERSISEDEKFISTITPSADYYTDASKTRWRKGNLIIGDMQKIVSEKKSYIASLETFEKNITGSPIGMTFTKTSKGWRSNEMDWGEYYRVTRAAEENRLGLVPAKLKQISTGALIWMDPGWWGSLASGERDIYLGKYEYTHQKEIKTNPVMAWGSLQVPAYTNVILPFAGGAIAGKALSYVGAAGGSLIGRAGAGVGTHALGWSMKIFPYAAGTTFMGLAGADIGYTAAMNKQEALGGFGSRAMGEKLLGYGMQFTSAGAGASWAMSPEVSTSINKMKTTFKNVYSEYTPKTLKNISGFKTKYADIRMAKSILKQPNISQAVMSYQGKTSYQRLVSGFTKAKNVLMEPSSSYYMRQYNPRYFDTKFLSGDVGRAPYGASKDFFYSTNIRDYPLAAWGSSYVTPKLEAWIDMVANRKVMSGKIIRYSPLESETKVIINPENPFESIFISRAIGKDVFSIGKITAKNKMVIASGKTYWKLSPDNVFYQEKPFMSISKSSFIDSKGNVDMFKTTGLGFGKSSSDRSLSFGLTSSRSFFEGEKFIRNGFFEQYPMDITIAKSIGLYTAKSGIRGSIRDTSAIFTPKLKGKEYYGETGGFDYSNIVSSGKYDLVMPGGTSGYTSQRMSLPRLLPAMDTYARTSVRGIDLASMEENLLGSSYWQTSTSKQSLFTLSSGLDTKSMLGNMVFTLPKIKIGSLSRSGLKTSTLSLSATKQLNMMITGTKTLNTQLSSSITKNVSVSMTKQRTVNVGALALFNVSVPSYRPVNIGWGVSSSSYKYIEKPVPPKIPVLFGSKDIGFGTGKRKKKGYDIFGKGYRYRKLKAPSLNDILGGKNLWA